MSKIKKRVVKKSVIIISITLSLIFMVIGIIVFKIIDNNKSLKIELIGDKEITIKYNSEYQDKGATAKYKKENLTKKIKVKNNLDLKHIGKYYYTYKIKYKTMIKEIKRTINVIDDDKPEIKLKGRDDLAIVIGSKYRELGFTAKDAYDGDLTNKVEINTSELNLNNVGTYNVKYKVKDSSGNEAEIIRQVKVVDKPSLNQKIPVLNYHFFYKDKNDHCNEQLCLRVDRFKEQLEYLKNEGFYTLTIQEFVSWMYGEIELPEKSVLLTIDDGGIGTSKESGNYLISALEEYKMHGTLFLITGWWPVSNYESDYLDIQSHTHELHYEQNCGHRSKVNCIPYEDLIKDLKLSIQAVGDTTSFCFPFYDYTDSSIKAVQEVGFKAAFIGEYRKASRNDDKYKIPRFPIYDSTSLTEFANLVN